MTTEGVHTLSFYDVGFPTEHGTCGAFSGTFDFDPAGNIECFTVDALVKDQKDRHFIMPRGDGPFVGDMLFAYHLGNQIAADYDREIKDALYESAVEIAEGGFRSDREEHGTLRVIRGRVA